MPARLTLDDLAAIACAPPTATPAELASQLGKPATLVGRQLRRMRRAGGWYFVPRLPPCTVCGETVVGPPRRTTHVGCVPARQARWVPNKRARRKADSTPDALAEQRAHERAAALRTYRSLSSERRAAFNVAPARGGLYRERAP